MSDAKALEKACKFQDNIQYASVEDELIDKMEGMEVDEEGEGSDDDDEDDDEDEEEDEDDGVRIYEYASLHPAPRHICGTLPGARLPPPKLTLRDLGECKVQGAQPTGKGARAGCATNHGAQWGEQGRQCGGRGRGA
ncbi:MAG: hypothetical protein VXW22_17460, partial [Pseudomonadota bacterium]|nr:hypothetical protein [Pseudomonadota bacterium]